MTFQGLRESAYLKGMGVATDSPGDGVRRYRFFVGTYPPGGEGRAWNYYQDSDKAVFTALGLHDAVVFLEGVSAGRLALRAEQR